MLNSFFGNKNIKLSYHIINLFIFYILCNGYIKTISITVANVNYRAASQVEPNGGVLMLVLTSFELNSNSNEIDPNIERFRARSCCQPLMA